MKIHLYEVWVPELATYAKFKSLPNEMVTELMHKYSGLDKDEYVRRVLDSLVFNLHSEIMPRVSELSPTSAKQALSALYNGCVMLNPAIDGDQWSHLAFSSYAPLEHEEDPPPQEQQATPELEEDVKISKGSAASVKKKILSRTKFASLYGTLSSKVVGQPEAISAVCNALTLSYAGMHDTGRPLGVFLFAGASGVGKTSVAKTIHEHLFSPTKIVRIDCGEYQHKHDNQKLLGSPAGYVGYDDGGYLAKQMKENAPRVLLLDEVEKAHPDLWNTFLRVFDEGKLTDSKGNVLDFTNTIIIMTTNLGNDKVVADLTARGTGFAANVDFKKRITKIPSRDIIEREASEAIRKMFKPEFLNRIDETVVFNYLTEKDYYKIAELELDAVRTKLAKKKISFSWDPGAIDGMIELGTDSIVGARGLSRVRRDKIELPIAHKLIDGSIKTGFSLRLHWLDSHFDIVLSKPKSKILGKGQEDA